LKRFFFEPASIAGGGRTDTTENFRMSIEFTQKDSIATVTLNRPDKKNAMLIGMRDRIAQIAEEIGIVKGQIDDGTIDPEEPIEAKIALGEEVRRLIEAEQKRGRGAGTANTSRADSTETARKAESSQSGE